MTETNKVAERGEPKRWLTKKDGLRHLLHASIRFVFAEEDPFATHVLAQSAEKVLTDLLKRADLDDPFSFERILVPKYKKEFFAIYREQYNFLKHADKDYDGKLPVHEIVGSNDILVLVCIVRYQRLFGELTIHMQRFLMLCFICYPHLISWDNISQQTVPAKELAELGKLTRGELLESIRESTNKDHQVLQEKCEDLVDVIEAKSTLARS